MQTSKANTALPLPVAKSLRKLGRDISAARKRRRITQQVMADRALTARQTIARVEAGDPTVSMGIYATVLFVLGFANRLGDVLDASVDPWVLDLDEERLPKRVRVPKSTAAPTAARTPKRASRRKKATP